MGWRKRSKRYIISVKGCPCVVLKLKSRRKEDIEGCRTRINK